MLKRIRVVPIPVSDQQAAKAFYGQVLGFELLRDVQLGPPGQRWVQLGIPGAETTIALVTWFEEMRPGCLRGIVLDTSDVEAARKQLQERGVEVSEIRAAAWGRYAVFADPDGNRWVLREGPAAGPTRERSPARIG